MLIVDDSPEDRYLLMRFLNRTHLELTIIEADSGPQALRILTQPMDVLSVQYPRFRGPVTVFLDINMPGMTGWELLEELELRSEEIRLKPAIVLIHTTSSAPDEKEKARRFAQVAQYLIKDDVSPAQLRKAILSCHC